MKELDTKSSSADTPLPKSATAAARCHGEGSSPEDHRAPQPEPHRGRAHVVGATADEPHLHPLVVEGGQFTDDHGGGGDPVGRSGGVVLGHRRLHPPVIGGPADAERPRPGHLDSVGLDHRVDELHLATGFGQRAGEAERGVMGTGRSSSRVTRVSWKSSSPGWDSAARATKAATGPPCSAFGDHGPRARSVGTSRGPSGTNSAGSPGAGDGVDMRSTLRGGARRCQHPRLSHRRSRAYHREAHTTARALPSGSRTATE